MSDVGRIPPVGTGGQTHEPSVMDPRLTNQYAGNGFSMYGNNGGMYDPYSMGGFGMGGYGMGYGMYPQMTTMTSPVGFVPMFGNRLEYDSAMAHHNIEFGELKGESQGRMYGTLSGAAVGAGIGACCGFGLPGAVIGGIIGASLGFFTGGAAGRYLGGVNAMRADAADGRLDGRIPGAPAHH